MLDAIFTGMPIEMKTFKVLDVNLEGSNLIEASAGTGKTYSIAILVLRMMLEKGIEVQEILMVTFTKAAVAELQDRVRKFIREAYKFSEGEGIEDKSIKTVVTNAIEHNGKDQIQQDLRSAIINLDETSIFTIHSFCQQTLNEFAFETKQIFSAELSESLDDIVEEETQKFWRQHITGIRTDLLRLLIGSGLTQQSIMSIVKEHFLQDKTYFFYDKKEKYSYDEAYQAERINDYLAKENLAESKEDEVKEYVKNNLEGITKQCESNAYCKKNLLSFLTNIDRFIAEVDKKKNLSNVKKCFPEMVDTLDEVKGIRNEAKAIAHSFLERLYAFAIQEITQGIIRQKTLTNKLSFDDLISNLHAALTDKPNPGLVGALRKKYKAIFIDEFQDTDRKQYEIFHTAFQKGDNSNILFYIGDPKQSIYAWRKADIATYLKARSEVDFRYTMNYNFRSSRGMIDAMNQFFSEKPGGDVFYYDDEQDDAKKIIYQKVNFPEEKKSNNFYADGKLCTPITIGIYGNKDSIHRDIALNILDLLTNLNSYILDEGNKIPVKPSDIAVLVNSHEDGASVKNELAKLHIPSVTQMRVGILQTDETIEMQYLLDAFVKQNRSSINKALMGSFTGWKKELILSLDQEKMAEKFRSYFNRWQRHGLYAALMQFVTDFGVQQYLLSNNAVNGERVITNFFHLAELLYKTEVRQRLGSSELVDWLARNVNKGDANDSEQEQRIESDEDAVNIVTIHSSKGLEYPIVFCESLDFQNVPYSMNTVVGFRDENSNYFSARYDQLKEEFQLLYQLQQERENRRKLYVAITRAKYACFIFKNKNKSSTLSDFIPEENNYNDLVSKRNAISAEENKFYTAANSSVKQKELKAEGFTLLHNNWQRMSYSRLAEHTQTESKPRYQGGENNYDTFIFKTLTRGAATGTFLHYIFEHLNFSNAASWPYSVEKSLQRFNPHADEDYEKGLNKMVTHIMNAALLGDEKLKLSDVSQNKTLHELEFDFPVELFSPQNLEDLKTSGIKIADDLWGKIEGMMNGKIDLFFEHDGMYYILDWKSNYLGPSIEYYAPDQLLAAMDANNYHLQYLIYTMAVKKYLKSRLSDNLDFEQHFGGVFYVFLRGVREGKSSGIFYTKPDVRQIEQLEYILEDSYPA